MKRIKLLLLLALLYHQPLRAQVCTGSLGDPTVLIDFGTFENPPAIGYANTAFKLTTQGCPAPGEYGLRGLIFNCYGNTWIATSADHTSFDHDGLYMLVNGTSTPGIIYTQNVDGLCPNTTYEMSVWVANLLRKTACGGHGLKPNMVLQVETTSGSVLVSDTTGNIPETDNLEWKEYATTFRTSTSTTSVVIKLINNVGIGDCGNVIALDDIAFRPCGPTVNAAFTSNNTDSVSVCENNLETFTIKGVYSAGFNQPVLQWQQSVNAASAWEDIPGQNSNELTVKPDFFGTYSYRLGVAESSNIGSVKCRIYSSPLTINVYRKPFKQLTRYVYGCFGQPVYFQAAGGSSYQWSGPNGFYSTANNPRLDSAVFSDEGHYLVKIFTPNGCSDTASLDLVIYPAVHGTVGSTRNICEGASVTLNAGGGTVYRWYPLDVLNNNRLSNPVATPKDTTKFMAIISDGFGCFDTVYQTVNVWKKPFANAGADKRTRVGVPVTLDGYVSGTDITFAWTPPLDMESPSVLKPVVNPPTSSYYTLTVQSNKGCGTMSDQVFVKVYDKIIIPNAFSPNGDGINDTWYIDPLDLFNDADLQVYNRYGQLVFRNIGIIKPWDGKRNGVPMPVGTYYYILDLKIKNEKPMTGSVTILR